MVFSGQKLREAVETPNPGGKAAEIFKVIDNNCQRAQDRCKGTSRLDRPTSRSPASTCLGMIT